jgi:hypothetical protein
MDDMTTVAKIMELAGIPSDAQFVTAAQMAHAMAIAREQGEATAIARAAGVVQSQPATKSSSRRSDELNAAVDRLCAERGIEPAARSDGLDAAIDYLSKCRAAQRG